MTPTKTAAILRRLADDWRHEEAQLCKQFGDVIVPRSMRARRIKDTEAINAAVEMIERLEAAERQTLTLTDALRSTAQTLAWMQHGKCRGFSDDLLTTNEALKKARAALEESK